MANPNPFSMSTLFHALHDLRFAPARQVMNEPPAIPTPPSRGGDSLFRCGIRVSLTPEAPEMSLLWIFNLMTRSEDDVPRLKDVISMFNRRKLQRMVYMLTSDSNYFMEVARNNYGYKNIQKLMGKSDDIDDFFFVAIMRLFLDVMTDKYASYVAIQGTRVFQQNKKELMYDLILRHALYLAHDQHGCIALNKIITDLDHPYYRNQLLDKVANNALWLSNDAYGNFVVQHVLKLYDKDCTRNIAANLRGHCVELSFNKYGSYIVERLLEAEDSIIWWTWLWIFWSASEREVDEAGEE